MFRYILLCFVCGGYVISSLRIHVIYSTIFFRVASLAIAIDFPDASEVTMKNFGKIYLLLTTATHHIAQIVWIIIETYT